METRVKLLKKITSSSKKSVQLAAGEIDIPGSSMQKVLKGKMFQTQKPQTIHKFDEDDSDESLEIAVCF